MKTANVKLTEDEIGAGLGLLGWYLESHKEKSIPKSWVRVSLEVLYKDLEAAFEKMGGKKNA